MNIEKMYDELKAFDSQLPTVVVGLMKPCSRTYCDCRMQVDEDSLVLYCAKKSDETKKVLDRSITALMNNPNILLLAQGRQNKVNSLDSINDKSDVKRIKLVELE